MAKRLENVVDRTMGLPIEKERIREEIKQIYYGQIVDYLNDENLVPSIKVEYFYTDED